MWFAMVCLFCIFSRCIFLVPGCSWDVLRWTLCLYFFPLPFLLICWPPSRLGYFHVTWSQNMTPYLSPAGCSCLQFWDKSLQHFPNLSNSFCVTYFVSSFGRPLSWILFQNWVMCLVLPTSKFGYQPSTVWKPRDYMEHTWNIHGT